MFWSSADSKMSNKFEWHLIVHLIVAILLNNVYCFSIGGIPRSGQDYTMRIASYKKDHSATVPGNIGFMCPPCSCQQTKSTGIAVLCNNVSLTNIPKCDKRACKEVISLSVGSNNGLEILQNGSFANLTQLREPEISKNQNLLTIEDAAFSGLQHLENFSLTGPSDDWRYKTHLYFPKDIFSPFLKIKSISFQDITKDLANFFKALCFLQRTTLTSLSLNNVVGWQLRQHDSSILTGNMSLCLRNHTIQYLSLQKNGIMVVREEFLWNFPHLIELNLRYNRLEGDLFSLQLLPSKLLELKLLDIGCQNTVYVICDEEMQNGNLTSGYQPGESLSTTGDVGGWQNTSVIMDHMQIYVSYLISTQVPPILAEKFNIKSLTFAYNNVGQVEGPFNFKNLKFLDIRGVNAKTPDTSAFYNFTQLEVLLIQRSFPAEQFNVNNLRQVFKNNGQLKILQLKQQGITTLCENLFENLNHLETLDLSENQISEIGNQFQSMNAIRFVNLSFNMMTSFPILLVHHMENLQGRLKVNTTLDIRNNSFVCLCSSLQDMRNLSETSIRLVGLRSKDLLCRINASSIVPLQDALVRLEKDCQISNSLEMTFLCGFYPFSLMLIVLCSLIKRYYWKVLLIWYKCRFHFQKGKAREACPFLFDAFVWCCNNDEIWVSRELLANLDYGHHPYKLCLTFRNFKPGRPVTDNIVSAVGCSRKTILIITRSYLKSPWGQFGIKFAQMEDLRRRQGALLAIVWPGVLRRQVKRPNLQALLDTVSYLEWPEEEAARKVFWMKIKAALGEPSHFDHHVGNESDNLII